MRSSELQRLAQREGETETVDQSEAEGDHPATMHVAGAGDVLDGHVDDRGGNQRLNERGEPQVIRSEPESRRDERDRVGDGEGRDDKNQGAKLPERDHQAKQEQQMIGTVQDVEESFTNEAQRRLVPAGVEV